MRVFVVTPKKTTANEQLIFMNIPQNNFKKQCSTGTSSNKVELCGFLSSSVFQLYVYCCHNLAEKHINFWYESTFKVNLLYVDIITKTDVLFF